ncbi:MAG: class I SAM-dependent methyltransferase [Deltaproteobacteria bacterium]|nr:class I SAM-dependent methyltransferase [Deltaproteobacteria bacterium]
MSRPSFPLRLIQAWLAPLDGLPLRMEFGEQRSLGVPTADATWTVRFAPSALHRLIWDFEYGVAQAFCRGDVTIDGDLPSLLEAVYSRGLASRATSNPVPALVQRALRNDRRAARQSAAFHYDVGNDFYARWLDPQLVYTCAVFEQPDQELAAAQVAKLDRVCRKLALAPGMRVIEAGAGWGALAMHMAAEYGVTVEAYNVSKEQVAFARARAAERGLTDRVRFVEEDWRGIQGTCDAFVSVGMLEHVGVEHYSELGEVIARVLVPEGRGLLHTIGRARPRRVHRWIEERIFPNAYPPTLAQMMQILEPEGFVTLDVENLRRHYAHTCRLWHDRFLAQWEPIVTDVGEERARAWLLYLAGSSATFASGGLQLFQLVFSRLGNDDIPWLRPV